MSNIAENLRVLVWFFYKDRDYDKTKALSQLALRTGISEDRLYLFLTGGEVPSGHEVDILSDVFKVNHTELYYEDLLSIYCINVLAENIRYLFKQLPRGGKKEFATWADTHESTVARWISGETVPGKENQQKIKEYFKLEPDEDLVNRPLFLSLEPVGMLEKRKACQKLLDELSPEEFARLYPALKKLLS
jgi:hypothetical protein